MATLPLFSMFLLSFLAVARLDSARRRGLIQVRRLFVQMRPNV